MSRNFNPQHNFALRAIFCLPAPALLTTALPLGPRKPQWRVGVLRSSRMHLHLPIAPRAIGITLLRARSNRVALRAIPDGLFSPCLRVGNNLLVFLLAHTNPLPQPQDFIKNILNNLGRQTSSRTQEEYLVSIRYFLFWSYQEASDESRQAWNHPKQYPHHIPLHP